MESPIAILVPLYVCDNSLYPIITRFFDSLNKYYPDIPIYVVDDASPLPHGFPVTVRNETNLGFTKTVNKLLELAKEDIMIIANDDLVIGPGQLDSFKSLKDNQIASPRDTASSPDDKFGSIWGMTRKTYKKLGPLDEQYRNFYSDVEYYNRAKRKKVEIVKWNDIVIEHIESATYKTLDKEKLLEQDRIIWTKL